MYLAYVKGNYPVAVKEIVTLDSKLFADLVSEVANLRLLDHTNIIKLLDYFINEVH